MCTQNKTLVTCKQRAQRNQTGVTNRWQLPYTLDCDLLGTSQAIKAARFGFNETMNNMITADSPVAVTQNTDNLPSVFPTAKTLLPHVPKSSGSIETTCQLKSLVQLLPDSSPEQLFYIHIQKGTGGLEPDVALHCLGEVWELHRIFLGRSRTLSKLYREAMLQEKDCREKGRSKLLTSLNTSHSTRSQGTRTKSQKSKINIQLDVQDQLVTKAFLSVALQNLYNNDLQVRERELVGTIAAAFLLQFPALIQECVVQMRDGISTSTVCEYYRTGCKYQQDVLVQACKEWLEANLVPKLGTSVFLRCAPQELLQELLRSHRLFTYNEYRLLRTVLYWVYLQLNVGVTILPCHNTIVEYFKSLPNRCAFLQQDYGEKYIALFQSLFLHGITESKQIEEMRKINVFPQRWLIHILFDHYQALQNGRDKTVYHDFNSHPARFGIIINKEPRYHSEIVSQYGFFFELKVFQREPGLFCFHIQRLKHTDPALSFQTECKSFSLCQECEVQYEIRGLYLVDKKWQKFSSGTLTEKFGLTDKTRKSKVFKLHLPCFPVYVTYSLLFPAL